MHICVQTTEIGTYNIKRYTNRQTDRMLIITNRQTDRMVFYRRNNNKKILIGSDTIEDASKISHRAV